MKKEEIEKIRKQILGQIDKLPKEQASKLREQIKNASDEEIEAFVKAQMKMAQQGQGQEGGQGKGQQSPGDLPWRPGSSSPEEPLPVGGQARRRDGICPAHRRQGG